MKNSLIKNNPVKTQKLTINLQSDTIDPIKHKIYDSIFLNKLIKLLIYFLILHKLEIPQNLMKIYYIIHIKE